MAIQKTDKITMHRFRDYVTFHARGMDTTYISAALARQFAAALLECAQDIESGGFVQSEFKSRDIEGV